MCLRHWVAGVAETSARPAILADQEVVVLDRAVEVPETQILVLLVEAVITAEHHHPAVAAEAQARLVPMARQMPLGQAVPGNPF